MDFVSAIRRDSDRFYAIADSADPTRSVKACPEWTIADLVWHLGEVHWFWGSDIEMRPSAPDELEAVKPERPATYTDVVSFGRAQAARMIELLKATPDDVPVWTWAADASGQNVGFIRRHQVQEAAVHRWDLESAATDQAQPIDADAAADAVDEILAITLPWGVDPERPLSGTVHLHCTDIDGEWIVHADGRVESRHEKADVAIRGTASDLLLGLYSRIPFDDLELLGDPPLAGEFLGRINAS